MLAERQIVYQKTQAGLHSAVGSVSDCISSGGKFGFQLSYITFDEIVN